MYFTLVFQQLVASSTHLFAKHITETMHPAVVVFYRGMFSLLAYGVYLLIRRGQVKPILREDWLMLLGLGILNIPMNQLMFVWGLKYTTPPNASLAYALSPAFVLVISSLLHGERFSRMRVVGIVMAIAGTIVILVEKGISLDSSLFRGNMIELGASISWSFYTVLGRRVAMKYGAVYSTALSMFVGFVFYLPVFLLLPVDRAVPGDVSPDQWFSLVYLGVVTSGIGFALWYYLLTKLEATKVSVFNNLQPILTTILSYFAFHNVPSPQFVIGGIIVLGGVIVTQRY